MMLRAERGGCTHEAEVGFNERPGNDPQPTARDLLVDKRAWIKEQIKKLKKNPMLKKFSELQIQLAEFQAQLNEIKKSD